MRRVLIVQARMTSTRLPGKVLMDIEGRPMIERQLNRLKRCTEVDEIVVATTINDADDGVVRASETAGVATFRGDEHDVLSRYLAAAERFRAGIVIRVTADCPLIDPTVTDAVIGLLDETGCDYASNIEPRTFPKGLDVEALTLDALRRLDEVATEPDAREHVTIAAYRDHPDLFERVNHRGPRNDSDLRWTVDTAEDLERIRRIYAALDLAHTWLPYDELVSRVRERPELS